MTDFERCPYRATDPITTRTPRDDGWRCGHEAGHKRNHELFTADGEHTLPAGEWVLGPDDFTLSAKMEAERAWNRSYSHDEWAGAEVNLGVHMAEWARKRLAHTELHVDIQSSVGKPTTCQVRRGDVLIFDGRDYSADHRKEEAIADQARYTVESKHQFHGSGCVCGFVSDHSRSRTKHIMTHYFDELRTLREKM